MHKSQGVGSPPRRGARQIVFPTSRWPADDEFAVRWRRYELGARTGFEAIWRRKCRTSLRHSSRLIPPPPSRNFWRFVKRSQLAEGRFWVATKTGGGRSPHRGLSRACISKLRPNSRLSRPGRILPIKFEAINRSKVPVHIVRSESAVSRATVELDRCRCSAEQFVGERPLRQPFRRMSPPRNPTGSASRRRSARSRWTTRS